MLLDQDTDIGTGYFVELAERLTEFESDPTLAALAPKVYSNGQQVSPLEGWNRRPVSGQAPSRPGAAVMAINSGLVVRREFVDKLGGFDQRFWLDGLDHWLLLSIRARGMHIRVMETRIGHDLSVAGEDTYVSADRYRNILAAEAILFREAYTRSERIAYLVRLLLRACVYPLRWGTFKYTWPSLRQLALLSKR
jgi:GT2 family glycosyltransferase